MKKLNITMQLFIIYLLHVIVLFVFLILVLYFAGRIHKGTEKIVKENVSSMEAAIHLKRQIFHQKEIMTQLMTEGWNPLLIGRLFQENENFASWFAKAKSTAYSQKEKEVLDKLSLLYEKTNSIYNEFLEKQTVPVNQAIKVIKDYGAMRGLCMEMLQVNKELVSQTMAKKDQDIRNMNIASVALLMVGFGLLFGLYFTRSITKPLRKILEDAKSVARSAVNEHDKNIGNEINLLEENIQQILYRLEDSGKTIDEQRQRLLHAERLAAMGELSAKIAHEVRNPLTGIRTGIQLIQRQNPSNEYFQQKLGRMIQELNRVERIVSDLLSYSRPLKPNFHKVDLIKLLKESAGWAAKDITEKQIKLEFGNHSPLILEADSDMLKQVFYNIFNNACENLKSDDRLVIKAEKRTVDSSSYVHLIFEDTGPGIKPDLLDKMFKPFFTNKPLGTGLGLSICQNIIMEHRGRIWAENGSERGLILNIILPQQQEKV
jgi:signal transduction histidine kinase